MNTNPDIAELRKLPTAELVARYRVLWDRPPRVKSRGYLWRRCALKLLEARCGGLSGKAKQVLDELVAEIDMPAATVPKAQVLSRTYKGRDYVAILREDGTVEHEGEIFGSLSAVARHITGAKWNGKLFFGLTSRKKAQR